MKIFKFFATLLLVAVSAAGAFAKDVELSGEASVKDEGGLTRKEAMRVAAEQARVNALADAFGTVISQDLLQTERNAFGRADNDFLALTASQVKGEWLGDTREPEYEFSVDDRGFLTVVCRVRGRAREISSEAPECEFLVLRNSEDRRNASTQFKNGDYATLLFRGSAEGYVALFQEDESRTVSCYLPFRNSDGGVKVLGNREYVLFGQKGDLGTDIDLRFEVAGNTEYERLYLLYSTEPFSLPPMREGTPPEMSSEDFTKWLLRARRTNPRLGVETVTIAIAP